MNDPYDVQHAAIASDDGMPEATDTDASPGSAPAPPSASPA